MSDARRITDAFGLDGLIPEAYAEIRPVLVNALVFFVGRLSAARRSEVHDIQSALPAGSSSAARFVALARACPVVHKLAQVVARHPALDCDVRAQLQQLEMGAPRLAPPQVERCALAALGDAARAFDVRVESRAAIEASVALVVPCRWRSDPAQDPAEAVLKILKPGVVDRLGEELDALAELSDHLDDHLDERLDERREAHGLPAFAHRETLATVRDLLRREVRLDLEQEHLAAARRAYRSSARVQIPAPLPFSTPAVTAMERVHGVRVTDVGRGRSPGDGFLPRRDLADTIVRALLAEPVFDRAPAALFHADPHAGNLFATSDGRLAILDWSLAGRLGRRERVLITGLILAALRHDATAMIDAVADLAANAPVRSAFVAPVDDALRALRRGRLPGPAWLVDLLDAVVAGGAVFPASLMLFRKSLLTLTGVVNDVDPRCSVDAVFLGAALGALARDWPWRFATSPLSRDNAAHASTLDLAATCAAAPMLLAAGWAQAVTDCWLSPRECRDRGYRQS